MSESVDTPNTDPQKQDSENSSTDISVGESEAHLTQEEDNSMLVEPSDSEGLTVSAQKLSKKEKSKSFRVKIILVLFFFLLLAIAALAVLAAWHLQQEKQLFSMQSAELKSELEENRAALSLLQNAQKNLNSETKKAENASIKRIKLVEQRIKAQHKKLQSISTTTREDWLLAEAEYLLRLANQRVLIERSPKNADALLLEADDILKNLADPDLYSLRQALARDLAQLRLVEEIDQNGIYFTLKALIDQIPQLALRPTRQQIIAPEPNDRAQDEILDKSDETETQQDKRIWDKFKASLGSTISVMNNYIKIEDHSKRPPPLLPPDSASYLQQNLHFKLERAQLALLREQPEIYVSSLHEVQEWINDYYPKSLEVEAWLAQVITLRDKNIVQTLPDITYSLELLHQYIENLHNLQGVSKPQVNANQKKTQKTKTGETL